MKSKGVALMLILGFVMVAVLVANVALQLITSHFRLTQHKVGRVQAIYAAKAGMNYALEMMRIGTWDGSTCTEISPPGPCPVPFAAGDFVPNSSQGVSVVIWPPATPVECPGDEACVSVTAQYTD